MTLNIIIVPATEYNDDDDDDDDENAYTNHQYTIQYNTIQ